MHRIAVSTIRTLFVATAFAVLGQAAAAQSAPAPFQFPTTNPHAEVHQRVSATDIQISYNRPRMKGRTIFGGLVPYGQVWRTGSDTATRLTFSSDVLINGRNLEAGDYELFTIPGPDAWTVIIHENQSQWGSYSYDAANDVMRFQVTPTALAEPVESFTLSVDDVTPKTAHLNITWERTRVSVPIEIDVRATVVPQVEAALQADGRKPYFLAAMFYYENDLDIDRAAELMALAIEGNPTHIGMLHRQALILAAKGDTAGAIAAAEKSLAGAQTSPRELREEYTKLNNALLERIRR